MDIQDKTCCPTQEDLEDYVKSPFFGQLCTTLKETYRCTGKAEYSCCSMERGWNLSFRKSGKTLCRIYPREGWFTVLLVVGQKEKERVEALLPQCAPELGELYRQAREWNGQRWLMIDLENQDRLYKDLLTLIRIRAGAAK